MQFNGVIDRMIAYKRKKLFIPVNQFQGGDNAAGLPFTKFTGMPLQVIPWGVGADLALSAKAEGIFVVPADMNSDWPLGVRAHYTAVGTPGSTATLTWTVLMIKKLIGTAIISAATGALDTIIPTHVYGSATDLLYQRTGRGIRNAGFLTRPQVHAGAIMQFSIALTATANFTLSATKRAGLLGIELDYVPMNTVGPLHQELDCPEDDGS